MDKLPLELTKLLYARFCTIYADKFVKSYSTPEFVQIWWEEWSQGMAGIEPRHIKDGLSYCRLNLAWPPSLAEFRHICESASGIPTPEQAFAAAIRGEFSHPVIAIAYDKVGSWAMKNAKEADLFPKFKSAYQESLSVFRSNPGSAIKQLDSVAERRALSLVPPPSKIPSPQEILGWPERFKQYQERAQEDKAKLGDKGHPTWPPEKIALGGKRFDQAVYDERKCYLLSVDERLAGTLTSDDWYDRVRYKREIEGQEAIKNNSYAQVAPKEKTPLRGCNEPRKAYNYWNN